MRTSENKIAPFKARQSGIKRAKGCQKVVMQEKRTSPQPPADRFCPLVPPFPASACTGRATSSRRRSNWVKVSQGSQGPVKPQSNSRDIAGINYASKSCVVFWPIRSNPVKPGQTTRARECQSGSGAISQASGEMDRRAFMLSEQSRAWPRRRAPRERGEQPVP